MIYPDRQKMSIGITNCLHIVPKFVFVATKECPNASFNHRSKLLRRLLSTNQQAVDSSNTIVESNLTLILESGSNLSLNRMILRKIDLLPSHLLIATTIHQIEFQIEVWLSPCDPMKSKGLLPAKYQRAMLSSTSIGRIPLGPTRFFGKVWLQKLE
jgi:hypothetical protein